MEDISKRLEELEKKLGIGGFDPVKEGYKVMVKLLNQQNEYLDGISIKKLIVSDDKSLSDEYKRAKDLWEKLPDMIKNVKNLREELSVEPKEEKKVDKPISAKDIASGHVLPD